MFKKNRVQTGIPGSQTAWIHHWQSLVVRRVRLLHAVTCPFSKYFQILYIFAQIFKYLPFF